MTTTEPKLPAGAEADEWYTIDHDGLPTSTGRNVTTPNLAPYPSAPDVRVQVVQHRDGSYIDDTLLMRVDDEEFHRRRCPQDRPLTSPRPQKPSSSGH
jgi:hypothetical protein